MADNVASLLKRGILDTLLQVAATTGVRFALILAIFVLSRFVSNAEIATYDLFVVASSILLILLTLGLDSGLVVVARTLDQQERAAYLWLSLAMSVALSLALYLPLRYGAAALGLGALFDVRVFTTAYLYAVANALMMLLFSYHRWLGKAFAASVIIVAANVIGFVSATIAFVVEGTVAAFIKGLLLGSLAGVVVLLAYVLLKVPFPAVLRNRDIAKRLARQLIMMSWPFGIASFVLIARRALDRAIILAMGMSTILGAYALVSRSGEVAAFLFALPALGFAPIIVRDHAKPAGRHIAQLLYGGYLILALVVIAAAGALWGHFGASLFPENAREAAPVFLALLASNLFFTETTVAGFGFVIVQRTLSVAAISLLFIIVNVAVAVPLSMMGYGLPAVAAGFLVSSFVHSSLFIYLSEKHTRFGYPLRLIFTGKLLVTVLLLYMLAGASPA